MSVDPGELYVPIKDIRDSLSALPRSDYSKPVADALASDEENFNSWQTLWLGTATNPTAGPESLWGDDGWIKVQEILAEMAETIKLLEHADRATEEEQDHAKVGRNPIRRLFTWSHFKKPQVPSSGSRCALDVALHIGQAIGRLRIHSELFFQSWHGIPAHRQVSPARGRQISRSVLSRHGAIALYQACQRSKGQCELDIDVWRCRSMPLNPQNTTHPEPETDTFYHILIEPLNGSKLDVWDITAKALDWPREITPSPNIKVYDEPDLAIFEPSPSASSQIIGIQPDYSGDNRYFQVAATHTATGSISESETLALRLKRKGRSTETGELQSLTLKAKVGLAYDLVQCGFCLLGTPWLASLSSQDLRTIETRDGIICVLRVQPMPLTYFDLDHALSELFQLSQIGMLLIDIALDGPEDSEPAKPEDKYLYASKKLPLVYEAMGSNYYRACAFCVQDRRSSDYRRSSSSYHRREKFWYPVETGWKFFLEELLEQYHVQVVSRYALSTIWKLESNLSRLQYLHDLVQLRDLSSEPI